MRATLVFTFLFATAFVKIVNVSVSASPAFAVIKRAAMRTDNLTAQYKSLTGAYSSRFMRIDNEQFLCAIKRQFVHNRHNDIVVHLAGVFAFTYILLIAEHIRNAPERKTIAFVCANTAFVKPRFYFFYRRAVYNRT